MAVEKNYIKGYNGEVTNGTKTGTVISESNPIFATVNASTGEEVVQDIGIRTDSGFASYGAITIAIEGLTRQYWALEYNGIKGAYGESITIEDQITDVNTIIKVYTKAGTDEEPKLDTSAYIRITGQVQSV